MLLSCHGAAERRKATQTYASGTARFIDKPKARRKAQFYFKKTYNLKNKNSHPLEET